jgi:hypothetical protein
VILVLDIDRDDSDEGVACVVLSLKGPHAADVLARLKSYRAFLDSRQDASEVVFTEPVDRLKFLRRAPQGLRPLPGVKPESGVRQLADPVRPSEGDRVLVYEASMVISEEGAFWRGYVKTGMVESAPLPIAIVVGLVKAAG